jgi:uncharacterized cupin superfamily protein
MQKNTIVHSGPNVPLRPAPINPAWILEGDPMARNAILSRSDDTSACTIAWDCTAGKFNWHYDCDETVHILEGSVIVSSPNTPPKRLEAGDLAFFPAGTVAHWHIETYVRKVAFCRRVLPRPAVVIIRALRRAKGALRRPRPAAAGGSLMEA